MHVCNISFQVNPSIETLWLAWMKTDFIPSIKNTACFNDDKLYQIEVPVDQYPTYTLQLYALNKHDISKFQAHFSDSLILQLNNKWGEQCLYFTTNMQIVN
jgi:hypothetical protein